MSAGVWAPGILTRPINPQRLKVAKEYVMQSRIVWLLFVSAVSVSAAASGVRVVVHSPGASACAILSSPVQFTATASSANPITGFVVYANNQSVHRTYTSSLNARLVLGAGTYTVYVRAWDSTGAYGSSPAFSITVAGGVQLTVLSPTVGAAALGSPVQFTAFASSANPITGFSVYANDQSVYRTSSSSLNAGVGLSSGTYSVYVRAWDSSGTYGTSPPFLITVGPPGSVQVTVHFPVAHTTLVSPLRFVATTTSAHPVTRFAVYANNQPIYQANGSSLNANVVLAPGSYSMFVRAWDSTGTSGTSASFPVTVITNTVPTPPFGGTVYQAIEDSSSGWGSCGTVCCAGGASDAWSWPMYQFQTAPSLDGASAEFVITGPAYADSLHWYKVAAQNWATNYLWDSWAYLDSLSSTAQALEFDAFAVIPIGGVNRKFMFGSQCNYAAGFWDGWMENTSNGGTWIPTNIPCKKLSTNSWHHLLWYLKRVGTTLDQLQYVSLTVDGVTYNVNMLEPSQVTSWNPVLGVQYQQDIGGSGTGFREWIDKVKLTIW